MPGAVGDAGDVIPGDGVCATLGGVCTLRAAIEEANAFPGTDTVQLRPAVYPIGAQLVITEPLALEGAGRASTRIDGGGAVPILKVGGTAVVTIVGVTLSGGHSIEGVDAGGLTVQAGRAATLNASTVRDCTNPTGSGGIRNLGTLTIMNSEVIRNRTVVLGSTAAQGGGINNVGQLRVRQSLIADNEAGSGGGLLNMGWARIDNSTFSGNRALGGGGGVLNGVAGNMEVSFVTITANHAGGSGSGPVGGGGVHIAAGQIRIANGILAGNFDGRPPGTPGHSPDCVSPTAGNSDPCATTSSASSATPASCATRLPAGWTASWRAPRPLPSMRASVPSVSMAASRARTPCWAAVPPSMPISTTTLGVECPPTDQRIVFIRPEGAACDLGAFERGD